MSSTTREALAACPFCAHTTAPKVTAASELAAQEEHGEDWQYEHSESYAVICDASKPGGPGGCGAQGGFKETPDAAIENWNRRAALSGAAAPVQPGEPAPSNSLPSWDECALRVSNSDFIAKRVAESGYGADEDSLLAKELHRFIHEYDDADPYRSAWFLHRLELLLEETKKETLAATPAAVPVQPNDTYQQSVEMDEQIRCAAVQQGREAMQQSLDAFDRMTGRKPDFVEAAIESLRAALAPTPQAPQPTRQLFSEKLDQLLEQLPPLSDEVRDLWDEMFTASQPQAPQPTEQPVAWLHEWTSPATGKREREARTHKPQDYELTPGDTVSPLFAASLLPAQAVPLTEAQIEQHWLKDMNFRDGKPGWLVFARAIEASHGIGSASTSEPAPQEDRKLLEQALITPEMMTEAARLVGFDPVPGRLTRLAGVLNAAIALRVRGKQGK